MVKTVELSAAQATLRELVASLATDDVVIIVLDQQPVAKLTATNRPREPRVPGLFKGQLKVVAEDEQHLQDFAHYTHERTCSIRV